MNCKDLIHPNDAAAINKLKKIPGFDVATRLIMKLGVEQYCRSLYMANHIRLSPKQLPKIYNLLPPICEKFGIDVPEFYLQMYPIPNAYTVGDEHNYLVITSGLLDCIGTGDELLTVLAHECGHILCRHVFYTTMIQMMLTLGSSNKLIHDVLCHIQDPLILAFRYWQRQSEFSADRASAAFSGNVSVPIKTILRLAGGPSKYTKNLNIREYVNQMVESEGLQKDKKLQKFFRDYAEIGEDHPFTATRVKELFIWGKTKKLSMR